VPGRNPGASPCVAIRHTNTLIPDPYHPADWDRFSYTANNPVNYIDPSGHITQKEAKRAQRILLKLTKFGVKISVDWGKSAGGWKEGAWTLDELQTVLGGVKDLARAMGGPDTFLQNLGGVNIRKGSGNFGEAHNVTLSYVSPWTVVHELAHAWDGAHGWKLSRDMRAALGAGFRHPILHYFYPDDPNYWYDPGNGPPPCGVDARFNALEDFAESVTAYVYPDAAKEAANSRNDGYWSYINSDKGWNYANFLDTPRGQYILALMVSPP
jgi:hypothetical protein